MNFQHSRFLVSTLGMLPPDTNSFHNPDKVEREKENEGRVVSGGRGRLKVGSIIIISQAFTGPKA